MTINSLLRTLALPAVAVIALVGVGCGDDAKQSDQPASTASSTTAAPSGVTVSGAWARTSPKSAANGAVYLTLASDTGDALVKASVDPSVAAMVEIHETKMAGTSMGSTSMGGGTGEMTMSPVDRIEIPAGGQTKLEPGGFHIMLMNLAAPLENGSTIKVTLTFETAAPQTVDVDVRDDAP